MGDRTTTATLSKGRSGWCVIFRHPACQSPDGRQRLRVRRGLGTRDESQAQVLVDQLNCILGDSTMWTPAARELAEARFDPKIVAAFYDHLSQSKQDPWQIREDELPLPGQSDGYARVQLVGTTGAGKTTVVRQLIGTDPDTERFPSISAAKTTICDIEIILADGPFRAVVTFLPRDRVRQLISECVAAAVMSRLNGAGESDVRRRFLEHNEQRFRLSYLLGSPATLAPDEEALSDDEDDSDAGLFDDDAAIDDVMRSELLEALGAHLADVRTLAELGKQLIDGAAVDLGVSWNDASRQDRDTVQELAEDQLVETDEFHALVDRVLDDVETRFEHLTEGETTRSRDGWPASWTFTCDDRSHFIRSVNRFSSNYAPHFGRLLTPLVEGIRVSGPFRPDWSGRETPRLVLLDGQGIGHTADSSSSISTGITSRFKVADAIVLVDNAAQPMQAAPCAVLQSLVSSGHESKLIVVFTHFDEVRGDNLIGSGAKKDHVIGSFDNAVSAIGKTHGREAETSLRRLVPDRLVFLANIQRPLKGSARLTRSELERLLEQVFALIQPPAPIEFRPSYDVANLVLAIQKAAAEFHDQWRGILGLGTRSGVAPEHWTRVKALTRRLGTFGIDEYDTLRPVADLIRLLQRELARFIGAPLKWDPYPPQPESEEMLAAVDAIKKEVFTRLHDLSRRRVLEERVSGWMEAYERRGTGSTRVRARDIVTLYESAAPVPNEMPGPDSNEFLFELREIIAESVLSGGGRILGWSRSEDSLTTNNE